MKKRKHSRRKQRKAVRPAVIIAVAAVILLVIFAVQKLRPDMEHMLYPRKYHSIVAKEAKAYELDESLVYAVIKAESDFDPNVESPVGALGLMQIMPETFDWMQSRIGGDYETSALFEPKVSIHYGCALLRLLLDEFGSLDTAICAYNAGMGNVTSWLSDGAYSENGVTLSVIPFEETRIYVQKVLQYKEIYEKLYGGIENG